MTPTVHQFAQTTEPEPSQEFLLELAILQLDIWRTEAERHQCTVRLRRARRALQQLAVRYRPECAARDAKTA